MPKYLVKGIFQHSATLKLYNPGEEVDFDKVEADRINEKLKGVYPITLEPLEPEEVEAVKEVKNSKGKKEEAKED